MNPITLPIAELKPALTGLCKIISRSSTLPILKMVRIERTPDGWITLTVTDLDTHVTVRLEEPTQGDPTAILVGYDDLNRITKRCQKNEALVVDNAGDKVLVRFPIGNQTGEEHLESLPADEFPPVPKVKSDPVSLPDEIRLGLQEAFQCASGDETRRILNGAYLDVSDRKCHQIVATDGRHLYGSNSFSLPLAKSILIPNQKFLGWKEFNSDGEWQIRVGDEPDLLQISSRKWQFITRQIEGNYPNWRQDVPALGRHNTTVELTTPVIESILALVPRIPCHDVVNNTLGLIIDGKKLVLRGRGANDSKWTDLEVEGATVNGKPVMAYLNRNFLTKALRFGMTEIQIIDSLSPLRFTSGGKQMIVMPVRGQDPAPSPVPEATPAQEEDKAEPPEANPPTPTGANHTTERSTMPTTTNGAGNGTINGNGHAAAPKPALETALEQVETIKGLHRSAIRDLNSLTDSLRQVQREQRAGAKEVQSVRTTLEKLQQVRI
jgi:DNA polymerase III sliding clamp (beta) subunit (PCNA family)